MILLFFFIFLPLLIERVASVGPYAPTALGFTSAFVSCRWISVDIIRHLIPLDVAPVGRPPEKFLFELPLWARSGDKLVLTDIILYGLAMHQQATNIASQVILNAETSLFRELGFENLFFRSHEHEHRE